MTTSAPGFPAIWEEAKQSATADLELEESGRSLSKRVFNALLNRSGKVSDPDVNRDRE
jgi:hypothetical protein